MEFVFAIILAIVIGYAILAWKMKLWPFKGKVIGVIKNTRQQAIIDTLTEEHPPVPNKFPRVRSQAPLSEDVKQGIIDAFAERMARARDVFGWSKGFDPAEYLIYVFPSARDHNAEGVYSPVFQVFIEPNSSYDGSIYDQEPTTPGGWIFAAEQVLTKGNEPINTFIIAANNQREYTQRVVSYALDHLFAAKNDRALYERTKDHSGGGGHPLW